MNSTNVDPEEIARFDALAESWWDPDGPSRALHLLNPIRMRFLSNRVQLAGAYVLDVGCGGGLLSEALARAGARVDAIDASNAAIEAARRHAQDNALQIDYRVASAESWLERQGGGTSKQAMRCAPGSPEQYPPPHDNGSPTLPRQRLDRHDSGRACRYDVITCLELIEHVPDPQELLHTLAALVKPGGHVFLSTINRSLRGWLSAIVGAEYVLGWLPKGTHDYHKLLKPSELCRGARAAHLTLRDMRGLRYLPLSRSFAESGDLSVNYIAHFQRQPPQ